MTWFPVVLGGRGAAIRFRENVGLKAEKGGCLGVSKVVGLD